MSRGSVPQTGMATGESLSRSTRWGKIQLGRIWLVELSLLPSHLKERGEVLIAVRNLLQGMPLTHKKTSEIILQIFGPRQRPNYPEKVVF